MKIAIISVTKQGNNIAEKIKYNMNLIDYENYVHSTDKNHSEITYDNGKADNINSSKANNKMLTIFSKDTTENFNINHISKYCMENYKAVIFISSTGIAVRSIAPYIKSKAVDPAVIVIDCTGKYVISLLSGHLGGANELAIKLANILNAEPIITTASDNIGFIAPDILAKENDLIIEDFKKAKAVAALLVEGKRVGFFDEEDIIGCPKRYSPAVQENIESLLGLVYITNKDNIFLNHSLNLKSDFYAINTSNHINTESHKSLFKYISEDSAQVNTINNDFPLLKLVRKNVVLGIGCKKAYSADKMLSTVKETLRNYNIDLKAVKCLATAEVKRNETAITNLAHTLSCNLDIWSLAEIKTVQDKYPGSDFVEKSIGVRAVCEPCAELSGACILTKKLNLDGMTLCIGIVDMHY